MKRLDCAGFWPGAGPVLRGARLLFDAGRVAGIERCTQGADGLLIPSFVDAHMHFSWKASALLSLDLTTVRSAGELLEKVCSAQPSDDPLIRGLGFDESTWDSPVLPSKSELDSVSGCRPAVLTRVCGHLSLANSALLSLIPAGTPNVDRKTGHLTEGASLGFSRMFPVSAASLERAMTKKQELCFEKGVTGIGTMEHLREAEILSEWGPRLRTAIGVFADDAPMLLSRGTGALVRWIKIFMDGTLGARSAAVDGCYADGSMAAPLMSDEQVETLFDTAALCGTGIAAHSIGAGALRQLSRVSQRKGSPAVRIEHAEELLSVLESSLSPSRHSLCMQPNFVSRWQMPGGMYESRLSPQRARELNPFARALSLGFRLGFGSDGMPFGPLEGLPGATGHPSPDQRLSVGQALHAYTLGAADVCGFSDLAGMVAPGRPAHLCLLSADPFRGVPWNEISVEATILDGEVVHGDPGLLREA